MGWVGFSGGVGNCSCWISEDIGGSSLVASETSGITSTGDVARKGWNGADASTGGDTGATSLASGTGSCTSGSLGTGFSSTTTASFSLSFSFSTSILPRSLAAKLALKRSSKLGLVRRWYVEYVGLCVPSPALAALLPLTTYRAEEEEGEGASRASEERGECGECGDTAESGGERGECIGFEVGVPSGRTEETLWFSASYNPENMA